MSAIADCDPHWPGRFAEPSDFWRGSACGAGEVGHLSDAPPPPERWCVVRGRWGRLAEPSDFSRLIAPAARKVGHLGDAPPPTNTLGRRPWPVGTACRAVRRLIERRRLPHPKVGQLTGCL